jgi:hypothetical protein
MRNIPTTFTLLAGIALASACGTAEKQPETAALQSPPPQIPVKDFFKNPEKAGFRISPNGQYFSYRAPWNNRMNIFVQKIGEPTAPR